MSCASQFLSMQVLSDIRLAYTEVVKYCILPTLNDEVSRNVNTAAAMFWLAHGDRHTCRSFWGACSRLT